MQLGEIISNFGNNTAAAEVLLANGDIVLFSRVAEIARLHDESVGEYAAGAVQRFANLAAGEDWLGLMNALERGEDPGIDCLTYMVGWSLKQDERPSAPSGCSCGGDCA